MLCFSERRQLDQPIELHFQSGLHLLQVTPKPPQGPSLKWWLSPVSPFKPSHRCILFSALKPPTVRHWLVGNREKHSKNENLLSDWLADWQLYWLIFKWDLVRRDLLTSGLIRYDPIQYSLWFILYFFSRANLCGTERTGKTTETHTWINNSSDPVTLHELKSVCAHNWWGTGLNGFTWGFEVQHCHPWTSPDAAGCRPITSSCWGRWCVFLRCCGSDKEKQKWR